MIFSDFSLSDKTLKALAEAGYQSPTPIQEKVIPFILDKKDVFGCAQTGTGKTASYVVPLIENLAKGRFRARMPRVLILTPTRELALQVEASFKQYALYYNLGITSLIGGESMTLQERALEKNIDVLIATPGRLLDIIKRGRLLLGALETLVIDEADRLLDMGFVPDVEAIMGYLPKKRQTLLFSATVTKEIRKLSQQYLLSPEEVTITPQKVSASTIEQSAIETKVRNKRDVLRAYLTEKKVNKAIIFCNRKSEVSILCRSLKKYHYNAGEIHGDLTQAERKRVLDNFHASKIDFLVASDIAARGIDVDELPHVINFDLPNNPEEYVHRIGRTGRAGKQGTAVSLVSPTQKKNLHTIEKYIAQKIPYTHITLEEKPKESKVMKDMPKSKTVQAPVSTKSKKAKDQCVLGFGDEIPAFFQIKYDQLLSKSSPRASKEED
tara:strand:+ start:414 stop:1730 length:1317 start_codon:yes stop_codon:yes gene_type:complete